MQKKCAGRARIHVYTTSASAHALFVLRIGADAICEKPLVLSPWNLDALAELEGESRKRIFNVLQIRLHPPIVALREKVRKAPGSKMYAFDLTYITARGKWYFSSWKGDASKSVGIPTAIHYPVPLHLQPVFAGLDLQEGNFPVSEDASKKVLSLLMHPYLTEDELNRITSAFDVAC